MVLDVLDVAIKNPLKMNMKVSKVVIVSGLLTFMYCIEFCIGVRTVVYTFQLWRDPPKQPPLNKHVCWTLCVAGLFTATLTAFAVNILSAIWEQKQLEDKGKERSVARFIFHIIIGGMIWRYIHLFCLVSKQFQKKSALLLTMTKFFFTQTFTIPMVIVHISVVENLGELVFDIISIFCISLNMILTCTMFSWCSKEAEELKKWDFETVNLIPLLFQSDPPAPPINNSKIPNESGEKEGKKNGKKKSCKYDFELILIKVIVLFQSFGFSLGRLLALGILLKLAGMYAVSIMFLQLLISVIYLKFQAPILVSDSLPKWRQLTRFAFMGYILIFEWHLNRDPKTAYDFSFNMKHNILYYCVATVESVFYLVTWTVTTSYMSKSEPPLVRKELNTFCRIILVIGSLALVFSLSIHIVLLFWRSRKISKLFYTVRRRYQTTKLTWSKYGFKKEKEKAQEKNLKRPTNISHIDISNPIPITKIDVTPCPDQTDLEKQTSYRDLREPVDDEIEIYFRKCESRRRSHDDRAYSDNKETSEDEGNEYSNERVSIKTIDNMYREVNTDQGDNPATIIPTVTNSYTTIYKHETKTPKKERETANTFKSKLTSFSDGLNERWEKMSQKLSGTVKDRFQKDPSKPKTLSIPQPVKSFFHIPSRDKTPSPSSKTPNQKEDSAEGYFVGDNRCYQAQSNRSPRNRHGGDYSPRKRSFGKETDDDVPCTADSVHREDQPSCKCYICKSSGDDKLRRRRSSSVPGSDLKINEREDRKESSYALRYKSNPNISQSLSANEESGFRDKGMRLSPSPRVTPRTSPRVTPRSSPKVTPRSSPKVTPHSSPKMTPRSSPRVTPRVTPKVSPRVSPRASPRASPRMSPRMSPRRSPRMSPRMSPRVSPRVSPKESRMMTPSVSPRVSPRASPRVTPSNSPKKTSTTTRNFNFRNLSSNTKVEQYV